jgi:hypothetical protein
VGIMLFESSRAFWHWEVGGPSKCCHCSLIIGNSSPDSSNKIPVSIILVTPELLDSSAAIALQFCSSILFCSLSRGTYILETSK